MPFQFEDHLNAIIKFRPGRRSPPEPPTGALPPVSQFGEDPHAQNPLAPPARFAVITSVLVLTRFLWPLTYNIYKYAGPRHRRTHNHSLLTGIKKGLSVPILPTNEKEPKEKMRCEKEMLSSTRMST